MAERRLLIADDDADLRAPVRRCFGRHGLEALPAESVAEPERVCRAAPSDVARLWFTRRRHHHRLPTVVSGPPLHGLASDLLPARP